MQFGRTIASYIVQESNEDDELEGLKADWSVSGFWDSPRTVLFHVCNTIKCQMRILNTMRIGEKSMGGLDCTLNGANVIYYYATQRLR